MHQSAFEVTAAICCPRGEVVVQRNAKLCLGWTDSDANTPLAPRQFTLKF